MHFKQKFYCFELWPGLDHIPLFSAVIFLYGDSLFGSDVSTGYGAPTSSYGAPEASYGAPEASYGAPAASYGAPAPAYGAPSYAANRYYVSLKKSESSRDTFSGKHSG